ncbi:origin recognition complex subunit 3 [Diaphorina citri]|uniref:Origin recognition complex subunit 3 n=1 Tax=Diaphorina citri TaxID=121845 RepID=A0A3Q0IVJ8_DIACI|nr:origin recognition complex subunit 3 [Diaphorina citri]
MVNPNNTKCQVLGRYLLSNDSTQSDTPVESSKASDVESDEDVEVNLKKTHHDFLNFQDYYNEIGCKDKLIIVTQSDTPVESSKASDVESDEDVEVNLKKTHYDFLNFQDYYNEIGCKDKLIIALQDYESFPCSILNEFLLILHEYLVTLPFILILGVSTSPSIIHSTLNYDVISTMKIHTFYNQPSIESLNLITDNIILNNKFPLILHHTILEFLIDNFLFYDFSLHTFMKGVKICILKHISMNNINALCYNIMNQTLTKQMINANMLNEIKELDSVAKLSIKKLDSNGVVKYSIELFEFITNMYSSLQCLFALVYDLPNNPLGKQLRDIYCIVLSEKVFVESSTFKQCLQLIQFISKQELLEKRLPLAQEISGWCS